MMIDQFTNYSTKLERLSDDELHCSAEKLVLVENRTIAKLIAHLAEMSSRKTALKLGYKSLYEYCVAGLNLSEGAVPARIHVANVSRRFPQLLVALAEGRISLTVAALLAPHLTEDNVDKLISDCAGMKRRETEEYIVAFRPKPVFEPSIRKRPAPPVHVESPAPSPPPAPAETPKSSPTILQPARKEIFAFPPAGISRTNSNGSPKLSASRTLRNTWPRFWRRRSISLSRRKTRRRGSSGEERSSRPPRRNLVQTRSRKKTSQLSLDTLPPRFSSEYTNVTHTDASIVAVMGGDVRRGQDSKSTTRTRLASFTATRSPFSGSYVRIIIF